MNVSRRIFLSSVLLAGSTRTESHEASVMETFEINGRTIAVLANHARSSQREEFAKWLRTDLQTRVRVRTPSGADTTASIFRVRMCFGRALILLHEPLQIRERDILTIVT